MSARVEVEGYDPFDAAPGATLLEACEEAGVRMESACGGFAACNSCRVQILAGGDELDPISEEEASFLDEEGQRLGCQIVPRGTIRCRLEPGC